MMQKHYQCRSTTTGVLFIVTFISNFGAEMRCLQVHASIDGKDIFVNKEVRDLDTGSLDCLSSSVGGCIKRYICIHIHTYIYTYKHTYYQRKLS